MAHSDLSGDDSSLARRSSMYRASLGFTWVLRFERSDAKFEDVERIVAPGMIRSSLIVARRPR